MSYSFSTLIFICLLNSFSTMRRSFIFLSSSFCFYTFSKISFFIFTFPDLMAYSYLCFKQMFVLSISFLFAIKVSLTCTGVKYPLKCSLMERTTTSSGSSTSAAAFFLDFCFIFFYLLASFYSSSSFYINNLLASSACCSSGSFSSCRSSS